MPVESNKHGSTLTSLFPSRAVARLVIFFAVHPGQRFHLRDLKRRTQLSSASLQRELNRLVSLGALQREEGDDNRVCFMANEDHDAWRGWALLLRSSAEPADVLREALIDAGEVEAAFVYGSTSRGDTRPGSDVDLFVIVADGNSAEAWRRQASEAEILIGRPVDVVAYSKEAIQERARTGSPFLTRVLAEPKTWVYGGSSNIKDLEGL